MGAIQAVTQAIKMPACELNRWLTATTTTPRKAAMNKIETIVAEETVFEITETDAVELSLPELDLIAGGSVVVGLA
jgi:hypothetical protein